MLAQLQQMGDGRWQPAPWWFTVAVLGLKFLVVLAAMFLIRRDQARLRRGVVEKTDDAETND